MRAILNLVRVLAIVPWVVLACRPANAEEQPVISGIGGQRCATLIAKSSTGAKPNDNLAPAITWIQGFISGLNMNADNDFYFDLTSVTNEQQGVHILAYCRGHPSEPIMNAALDLTRNYLAKKPMHR